LKDSALTDKTRPHLMDLYAQPGHLLRRAQQISVSIFYDELGQDITPVQYAVLRTLVEHPGIDQVTLAGLVAIDTSTAASVAIRLEEKGLLHRHLEAGNRRQRALHLTEAGLAVLHVRAQGLVRLNARIFEGFSDAEQTQFMQLLQKLVHLKNEQSRAPLTFRAGKTKVDKAGADKAAKRKPDVSEASRCLNVKPE